MLVCVCILFSLAFSGIVRCGIQATSSIYTYRGQEARVVAGLSDIYHQAITTHTMRTVVGRQPGRMRGSRFRVRAKQ